MDINIAKTDSGRKVDAADTVKDAITGGLISGIKDLTNALGWDHQNAVEYLCLAAV